MSGKPDEEESAQKHDREEEESEKSLSRLKKIFTEKKKIPAVVLAAVLILASISIIFIWDYDGDGLANHQEMPVIGSVESDWTEYDTSGDGLSDGTAHDLGLDPSEEHPSVSAAYEGGLRGDKAVAFQDVEVSEEDLKEVASRVSELEDPAEVEDTVNYLADEPDHISALITSEGEVSELGFEYRRALPPSSIEKLSDVPLSETSEGFVQSIKEMDTSLQKEYIESALKGDQLSELGVYATPELPPEVVAKISPFPLDDRGKDLVEHIKDEDPNTQMRYVDSVIYEGELSELGVYAIPHLPPETIGNLSQYPLHNVSQDLVYSLAEVDIDAHTEYLEAVVVNENISELGVYATPELPAEVVVKVSPYELDGTAKDLVEYMQDENVKDQKEYVNAVTQQDDISDLGVYAIPHLGPDTVSELSPFDLDETGEELVDKLTQTEEDNRTEYVNAAEHDGRLSELGVYSVSYLTPEAVEEVSPFAFDDTGRELVQEIKNMDLENQTEYVDAVSPGRYLSDLGVDYIGDVTPEALDHISELSNNRRNRSFAENVSGLPGDVQLDLAKEYAGDGQITEKELEQSYFLNLLQDKGELQAFLDKYNATDYNVDKDRFTNFFELDKSDFLEYDTENRVYAAHINALEGPKKIRGKHFGHLMDAAELPEDRVWEVYNESATWPRFQNLTDYIQENMTEDDLLLMSIRGDGTQAGAFAFNDKGIAYDSIAKEIEPLSGLKAVFVDTCFGGVGKEHFQDLNNTITLFSADENNTADAAFFPGTIWDYMRTSREEIYLQDKRIGGVWNFMHSSDLNGDGEVSLGEAWETYRETHLPTYNMTPEDYQESLYENVSDPEARRYPQVVGDLDWLRSFYVAQGIAKDRSDERRNVVHPY